MSTADGRLHLKGPRGALDAGQRQELGRLKPWLLELLGGPDDEAPAKVAPAAKGLARGVAASGPLPEIERGLWFLSRLAPDDPSYNVALVVEIEGPLDGARLSRAVEGLIDRQPLLRTVFVPTPDGPLWRVAPRSGSVVDRVSAVGWDAARRRAWLDGWLERPFDLETGPVFRVGWLDRGDGHHLLVATWHHLVGDARSAALILRQIEHGFDPALPNPTSAAQPFRRPPRSDRARDLEWWKDRLTPLPPRLDLPADRRRSEATPRGDCLARTLEGDLVTGLRALARRFDATLFMVGAAIVQLLLARLGGLSRVALATPVDQRDAASADALGLWVNPVIIDVDLAGAETFGQLVRRARQSALEAFDRSSVPLGELVRQLAPPRAGTRQPLVSVMFNVAELAGIRLELSGCRSQVSLVEPGARYDLTIYLLLDGDRTRLEIAWNRDLFDRSRIENMLRQLEHLMTQVVAPGGSERRLDHLLLEPPAPRRLAQPSSVDTPPAQHRALAWGRKVAGRVAIEEDDGTWSYGRLVTTARELAQTLGKQGIAAGDVVVVEGRRSADFVAAVLGVLEAGAALAVLDPALPVERLVQSVRRWSPAAWVHPPRSDDPGSAPEVLGELGRRFPGIPRVVVPSTSDCDGTAGRVDAPSPIHPSPTLGGQALAWVPSTSGTTGEPRVVATPHGPVSRFLDWAVEAFGLDEDDRFALLAGLGHDPLIRDVLLPSSLGATLVCPPGGLRRDGPALARWLDRRRITALHLTPALAELLTLAGRPLPHLRSIALGGDRLGHRLARELGRLAPKARLFNVYGTTETPQVVACHPIAPSDLEPRAPTSLPVGRGVAGVALQILGRGGRSAGLGELGEVAVAGDQLAWGILGEPAATAERFVPDPTGAPGSRRYRTGDLGRTRPDGAVVLAGRRDRQVQVRGSRLEPGEIEALLRDDPAVVAAAVGVPPRADDAAKADDDSRPATQLTAWVVTRRLEGGGDPGQDLRQRLRLRLLRHLPEALVPSRIVTVGALPLTANGKVDFAALAEHEAPPLPPTGEISNPRELAMATLWAEILGVQHVPRQASFFELGGHSLLVPRLLDRVRDVFGSAPPLATLFQEPTVAALTAAIETDGDHCAPRPTRIERRPPEDWRLSPSQKRLWFLQRLDPSSPAYNLARALDLRGALDGDALAAALAELVARHPGLRTLWVDRGGEPRAVLLPVSDFGLARVDLAALPEPLRQREVARCIDREAQNPFALDHEPPLRTSLAVLSAEHHVLLLTLHHLAADATSIGILAQEFSLLYRARIEGRPSPLVPLPCAPGDLSSDGHAVEGVGDLAWWRHRLAEAPALELPLAHPYGGRRRGAVRRRALPDDLGAGLDEAARSHSTTPFVLLLGAWKLLLARLGGGWDLVVGTSVQRRPREAEGLIGLFLDTLPLRTELAAEQPWTELVRSVHRGFLDALVHPVEFATLVETLAPRRDLDDSPFFQTFFNLIETRDHRFELGDLEVAALPRREDLTVKLDLGLHAIRTEAGLELLLIFDARRIEPAWGEVLLAHLEHLLRQTLEAPSRRLVDFELLLPSGPGEPPPYHPRVDYPRPLDSVDHWIARTPEAPALRQASDGAGATWTYGELGGAIERLANTLRAAGVRTGHRVAIHGRPEAAVVVTLLAVWRLGGVVLLVDHRLPEERRRRMAERVGLDFVVDWVETREEGSRAEGEDGLEESRAWHGLPAERVVSPNPRELFEPGSGSPREAGNGEFGGSDAAYIVFTSGSTGEPKGWVGSHRALGHFFAWQRETFAIGPGDRVALLTTLAFDAVLRDVLLPLSSGATLSIPSPSESPARPELAHWLVEEKVTVAHRVPSLARVELAGDDAPSLPNLRWLFLVGEPLHQGLVRDLERRTDATLVNLYGPTETTLIKSYHPIDRCGTAAPPAPGARVPVGQALPETRILVVDSRERPCGVGEVGEVWIQTPHRTLGALPGAPDPFRSSPPTLAARAAEGSNDEPWWYATGDLGYRRPDGALVVVGRRDEQLKVHGVRVEPGEVETVLESLPEVAQGVVVGHRVEPGTEDDGAVRLVAYIVPSPGQEVDPAVLRRRLRERLPEALVPSRFLAIDPLPRTATGKIDRRALELRPLPGRPPESQVSTPLPGPETQLADTWKIVLGVDQAIHRDDDFFALGGHSLLATRLLARLRGLPGPLAAAAHRPEALRTVFEFPTLADQARRLTARVSADENPAAENFGDFPRAKGTEHPLSFHQRRLWFLERFEETVRFEKTSGAYHVARSLPLRGALDPAALEAALAALARRHGVLRTALVERGDEAMQRRLTTPGPWLLTVDLSRLPQDLRDTHRRQTLATLAHHPFDLAAGRLLRSVLLDLGDASGPKPGRRAWELALVFHHLAVDAPSLETFARELAILYDTGRGRSGRLVDPLPRLRHDYTDYAVWQRRRFDPGEIENQAEPWRTRLASAAPLELAGDRPRPNHGAHRGARCPVPLDGIEVAELEALGRRQRASLFMVLAALFQALLGRLSGQDDVSLGTPVNQRPHPDLEPLMGFFANSLVLRCRRVGDPTFADWLHQVREVCLDAFSHQELPFEVLVAALDPERHPGRNPLFQALLALHHRPATPLGLPGLDTATVETWGTVARLDLQWVVVVDGGRLRSRFEYSADLFDATTVQRWGAALGRLARAVLDDPGRRWSTLPLLGSGERHQLLHGWNDTQQAFGDDSVGDDSVGDDTLVAGIRRQVEQTPEAVAVEAAGVPLTYGELGRRANQLSHRLLAEGLPTGARVAVAIERSHELLIALLGILGAGAAYVPLDPSYPEARLLRVLDDARPFRLVTCGPILDSARAPRLDLRTEATTLEQLPTTPPVRPVQPLDLAYVIFTSGSTGRPKGVMCGHRSVVNRLRWMQERFPIGPHDRVLQKTPVGFDVSVWELFWPLLVGARVVMARPDGHRDTGYLRRVVRDRRVTTLHFVPSMLRIFLDEGGFGGAAAESGSSLRRVFTSGEALPRDLANRFLTTSDAELHNLYGPTEAAVDVTWEPLRKQRLRPAVSPVALGRPIANLRTTVVDARLHPQPIGVEGEIVLAGTGLARGYLDRPALTALAFVPDPLSGHPGERLYRTGDRVRQRPDGRLDFLGRLDHQVKVRGFRIELGDVESHLVDHPDVGQAVVALDDDRLVAWCVVVADRGITSEALRHHLAERLPEAMVPTAVVVLDELPLLPNGKVDRKRLPKPSEARTTRRLGEPESPLEALLAEVWTEVLARPVGRSDNFFEVGGDSILALRIVARCRPRGLDLRPRDLFDHQTLADLARWLVAAERVQDDAEPGETGPVVGLGRWTPIQRHFFDHLAERGLDHPHHFNWTRLWRVTRPLGPSSLPRLAGRLEEHHDALRSRFPSRQRETCRMRIDAPGEPPATWIDLSRLDPGRARAVLERACAQAQSSLDLESGPLWRLVGLALPGGYGESARADSAPGEPEPRRLLLVAHHLVVDGVSWSLLAEDLGALLNDRLLPPRTTSVVDWVDGLADAARDPTLAEAFTKWLGPSIRSTPSRGRRPAGLGSQRPHPESPRRMRHELDRQQHRRLREQTHRHRLRVDEVLLTALALELRGDLGPLLLLDLEGHGREPLRAGLDASRTVGWLTALYPVALDLGALDLGAIDLGAIDLGTIDRDLEVGAMLRRVKESLRTVPHGGLPFGVLESLAETLDPAPVLPARPILFNYLGAGASPHRKAFRHSASEGTATPLAPLLPAEESPGATRGPRVGPSHPLELVVGSSEASLRIDASWWPERWDGPGVQGLVERWLERLGDVLAWLETPEASCLTPSDFPLAGLDTATLDRHLGALGSSTSGSSTSGSGTSGSGTIEPEIEDLYPTSATQEAILYYHLYHPRSTAYFDHTSFLLDGAVEPERVRRAGQRLLDHHPILRTTVRWQGLDEPLQVVWRRAELPFEELDWRHLEPRRHETRLRRFIEQDRLRGCDLSRPPLLRWTLIRLAAQRYRLVWSYHHLILDGWSLPLLLHDFYRAYREPAAPLPPSRPFRDFIGWLALHDRERAAPFWRRSLSGFAEATPLPFDRPARESAAGPVVRGRSHSLDDATSDALTSLAHRARVTLNTVVQAAWALVLGRYSGERDVLFGATLAGRPPEVAGIESMVGLFVNTLPVRVDTSPAQRVLPWLAELQTWNVEMRTVDDSRLFDLHRWSAVPPGSPLFESALLFQSYPRQDGPVLEDLGIVSHGFRAFGHTSYPLTLTAKPRRRLLLQLAWDTLRFDATTARRLLATLVHTLGELCQRDDGRLGELRRLRACEGHQLLVEANDRPVRGFDQADDPVATFRHWVRASPEAPAVVWEGEVVLSYGELGHRVEVLASLLEGAGAGPETPMGLFVTRSPEMLVAVLAVLATGATSVPLDPLHPPGRLAWILEDMGVHWILAQRKLIGDLPSAEVVALPIDGLGSTEASQAREELRVLAETLETTSGLPRQEVEARPARRWLDEALAYVLYTSGSTGRPKAVGIPRRALATYCCLARARFELGPGRRMLQFASLGFDTSVEEIFPTLTSGATLVLRNERMLESPAIFLATIDRWGIDVLDLPTAYWHQLCAAVESASDLPKGLRTLILGGEAIRPELLDRWHGLGAKARVLNTYGPTEGTIVAGDCELLPTADGSDRNPRSVDATGPGDAVGPGDSRPPVSIGRPLPGTRWFVVDRRLEPAPLGAAGELVLGGDRLARGYLHRPALTAQRFVPDPWSDTPGSRLYRTGDRVRGRGDGELLFLGRIDHQVKVRGLRIELGEVETVLAADEPVREVVASVVDGGGPRARLVAHIVPQDLQTPPDVAALRRRAKHHLPFYMLPSQILVVPDLPRTPSGKVDRRRLVASVPSQSVDALRGRSGQPTGEPPRGLTERTLATLFAEILGLDDPEGATLGRNDEYFDLGGDSLLAVRLMARIERRFGVPLTLAELFADFTIAGLASRLAPASESDDSTVDLESSSEPITDPSRKVLR